MTGWRNELSIYHKVSMDFHEHLWADTVGAMLSKKELISG